MKTPDVSSLWSMGTSRYEGKVGGASEQITITKNSDGTLSYKEK